MHEYPVQLTMGTDTLRKLSEFDAVIAISPTDAAPASGAAFDLWNALMASAVEAIGTPQFPQTLETALHKAVAFEMMNGFIYSADGRAHDLYNDRIKGNRSTIVDQYLGGAFALDPFYAATRCDQSPRFIAMRALAPTPFDQSEYYRQHYAHTGIVDECGFVFGLPDGSYAVLSLSQVGSTSPFDDHTVRFFGQVAPLICAICAKHWSHVHTTVKVTSPEEALRGFGHATLTRREAEIVTLMLKGHSSLSIASVLELSFHTIKVHRRNIYAKLRISSYAELLTQHLSSR